MLLYPPIDELNEKADSRYTLAVLAAKRARDIVDGKPVFTDTPADRAVSIACNEIYEGKITYKRSEELENAKPVAAVYEVSGVLDFDIREENYDNGSGSALESKDSAENIYEEDEEDIDDEEKDLEDSEE